MNRSLTAAFAALEAAIVVAIGIVIPLAPLTILWAVQYGMATDWLVFWRAAVDTWLLGHGADLHVVLDEALATSLGLSTGDASFVISIAPLGFALLTVLLALRAGRRVGETPYRNVGTLAALATFVALTTAATLSVLTPGARPSVSQSVLLPSIIFILGFTIGLIRTRRAEGDDDGSSLRDWIADWPDEVRALVGTALRGGAAVTAAILALSSVLVSVLIAVGYARVISLYESVHAGVAGGVTLTLAQLAFVPNAVIWAASWLLGPGFAIGTGSSVSPLSTVLGPVPSVPLLGALPTGEMTFGLLGTLVPIVAAFVVAALLHPRLARQLDVANPMLWLAGAGLSMGVVAGLLIGILAWFSGGAAGPGRLVQVGPDPFTVGAVAVLEIGLAAVAGLLAASRKSRV